MHYELRRTTVQALFPGEFTLALEPGGAATTERADISISLAPGRALKALTSGLDEAQAASRPDGGTVRHWHLAPGASGAVTLEASTFADYAALGRAYAARAWPQSRPSPAVRALAEQLAPPGTDERETALRLYRHVANTIRYVATFLGEGRVVPRSAAAVLAEGWGDCKDHAALLQALLAAKGIEAQPALISLHNSYTLPDVPGLSALDHVITYVPSLNLYLDSTAPYAPFGLLLAAEYDKPVVLAAPDAARLSRTPPLPAGGIVLATHTEARIGEDGLVSGTTTTVASGPQSIALRSMAAWFEGRGTAYAASSQLQSLGTPGSGRYAFQSPENAAAEYSVEGRFALDEPLFDGGGAPFQVPSGLGVFGRPGKLLLGTGLTEDGGHACYPGRELEEIALELPPGAHPAKLPSDVAVRGGAASYTARYETIDGVLRIRREFLVETARQPCSEAEFAPMRTVLAAARRDQHVQVSLVRDPAQRSPAALERYDRQLAHDPDQVRLALEADARQFRHGDVAVLDPHGIREPAIGLEQVRIALVAAQPQPGRDVERHLVPAMRDAAGRRPPGGPQHLQSAQVFDQPIRQRAVELQPVPVRPHARRSAAGCARPGG